ncbi:hypothetical protein LTR86_010861 [Recurvomyces mirabilis]|nr:hypothetical protein LTR86_010861 [Recurvomyces mirabilis]
MKCFSILAVILSTTAATTVSYDTGYDDASRSMNMVACSDGTNGLETKRGWMTQGAVAGFPYIGGSNDISAWNSPSCGQCYAITYNGKTIHMLAIDHDDEGINMSEAAMNDLTGGQAVHSGRVDAEVIKIDGGAFGF